MSTLRAYVLGNMPILDLIGAVRFRWLVEGPEPPSRFLFFHLFCSHGTGFRRSLSLALSDARVYEPRIRARFGTTAQFAVHISTVQEALTQLSVMPYRGSSLIRNCLFVGPYSRTMSRGPPVFLGGGAVSYERDIPVPPWVAVNMTKDERFRVTRFW
jgi:hypothetical protein